MRAEAGDEATPKSLCPPKVSECQPLAPTAAFLAGQKAARCWAGRGNPNSAPMKGALCAREGAALLLLLLLFPLGCLGVALPWVLQGN